MTEYDPEDKYCGPGPLVVPATSGTNQACYFHDQGYKQLSDYIYFNDADKKFTDKLESMSNKERGVTGNLARMFFLGKETIMPYKAKRLGKRDRDEDKYNVPDAKEWTQTKIDFRTRKPRKAIKKKVITKNIKDAWHKWNVKGSSRRVKRTIKKRYGQGRYRKRARKYY